MRKSVTKIVKAVLGFTMAIGAGVGACLTGERNVTRLVADNDISISEATTGTSYAGTNFTISGGGAAASGYYKLGSATFTSKDTYNIDGAKTISYSITTRKFGGPSDSEAVVDLSLLNGSTTVATASYSPTSTTLTAYSGSFTVTGDTSGVKFIIKGNGTSGGGRGVGISAISFTATSASGGDPDPDPTTYTVTYNANGGTPNTVPTDANEYESGSQVTVQGNTGNITKSGKVWSGWNTAANGTGTSYKAGDKFNITADTTLYARWIDNYSSQDYVNITAPYLNLPVYESAYTAQTTIHADDGIEYVTAPGGANRVYAITSDGNKAFDTSSLSKVFMGKSGAYLYNKDPFPRSIDKVEVYASSGCSQSVNVAVDLGTTVRSASYTTSPTTLSTQNHIYTLKEGQASHNYTYFRFQVTNANNANVQIRITFSKPTTSVTVAPDSVTLNPGDTQQLTTTVLPVDNTDTLSYESSDEDVATVSNDGLITAVGVGSANITATSGSCSGVCAVTVELPTIPFITPNKESTSGFTGAHEIISFLYGNLGSDALTVVSSNESIVTVGSPSMADGSGTVQINFVGAGSTTVKFKAGAAEKASLSVSVTASSVTISGLPASTTAYVGKTLNLGSTITINTVGIYSDDVTWESSNDAVAEVSASGVVTGIATGTVDITVTSDEYPSATMTCEVDVVVDTRWDTEFSITMVDDIVLPASGDTAEKYYVVAQITAITNTNYGNGNAVDEDGTEFAIYGMYNFNGNLAYNNMPSEQKPIVGDFVVLYGVFTKYNNAPEIKNAWVMQRNGNVFQTPALTGITLNKNSLLLGENKQFTLTAGPNPVDAEMPAVTWESSNDAIASVNSSGVVTGESSGSATITATAGGFTATCNVTVSLSDTMEYNAASTSNMAATGNAATVNLNSALFTVDAAKGGNANFPGLNKDGDIRAYDGNDIIVAIDSEYTITNIAFDFSQGASYCKVYVDGSIVAGSNNIYAINSDSFKIHANGGQVRMNSVEIFYREATAAEKVSRLDTQSSLAYSNYADNGNDTFTYENLGIRFGGTISKTLWDALEAEADIQGYGVLFSTAEFLGSDTIEDYYNTFKTDLNTVDEALAEICNGGNILNFSNTSTVHEPALKTTPTLVGNEYVWRLYNKIPSNALTTTYVAVAYIRVAGGIIFLNEERASAQSLAADLINTHVYESDAFGGSLNYLATRP